MSKGLIPISEGKRLATEYRAPVVIVFSIHDNGDSFNVMSYGMSRALCTHAASLAKQISEKVLNGEITPAAEKPAGLPEEPTQWSNGQAKSIIERAEKAEAFKKWVHDYLDAHGVPHHPPGVHGAEGCRIGDRMDWLMAKLEAATART